MNSEPKTNVKTPRGVPDTEAYRKEAARFSRDEDGIVTYDGKKVCKFYNTWRRCYSGDACKDVHIKFGCAYYFLANQGCCFPNNVCPFSHEETAVVNKKLFICKTPNCENHGMYENSSCQDCYAVQSHRKNAQSHQRQDFMARYQMPPVVIEERQYWSTPSPFSQQMPPPPPPPPPHHHSGYYYAHHYREPPIPMYPYAHAPY